jgi:hypothetical protein
MYIIFNNMKRLFSIFVVVACGMFAVLTASAQKTSSFAGTVKFSVKFEGNTNPQDHSPHEVVFTIFGNKTKQINGPWIIIADGDNLTETRLFDYPGNRGGFKRPKESFEQEQEGLKYTYVKSEETKTICGYVCTRYDITIYDAEVDEEKKVIAYTTTEIGTDEKINNFDYPGLKGFPLYEEIDYRGVKEISEAIEVKQTKVKSADFLIPSDYKMMNFMEFNAYLKALFNSGKE